MKRLVLFLIAVISITFCGYYMLNNWNKKSIDFEYLKQTTRITISTFNINDEGNEQELCETRTIDDAMEIRNITSKLQAYTHYWHHEQFSPPWTATIGRLSPIQVTFYKNEKIETILTIGYLDGFGYYLQQPLGLGRRLSSEEFEELMSLIEIDKGVVHNQKLCD
jgi:hypothetical protein